MSDTTISKTFQEEIAKQVLEYVKEMDKMFIVINKESYTWKKIIHIFEANNEFEACKKYMLIDGYKNLHHYMTYYCIEISEENELLGEKYKNDATKDKSSTLNFVKNNLEEVCKFVLRNDLVLVAKFKGEGVYFEDDFVL